MMLYVANRINISMVSDFIRKTLRLPVHYYEKKMTSGLINTRRVVFVLLGIL